MDQFSIVRDLLVWLENHLDQPLSLQVVAAKSGYSKWHMQRMFKEVTGQSMGNYIRARRLSKAAIALRLTSRSILLIALQYHFDSQASFTRAFKKQIGYTPALYRRSDEWTTAGIRPPIHLGKCVIPQPDFVDLPAMYLVGLTQSYTCALEEISHFRTDLRVHFWRQYLGKSGCIPPILYGLHHSRPSLDKDDEQEVFYTTAIKPEHLPDHIGSSQSVKLEGGEYAKFIYAGPSDNLQDFIIALYSTALPMLRLARRKGHDIELFRPQEHTPDTQVSSCIYCEYFIPVRRAKCNA